MDTIPNTENIELSDAEYEVLRTIFKKGCISDEPLLRKEEPYPYLYRIKLIERFYSSKFPYRDRGELSLPLNALRVSDRGRVVLQRAEKERRDQAKENAAKKRDRRFDLFLVVLGAILGQLAELLVENLDPLLRVLRALVS